MLQVITLSHYVQYLFFPDKSLCSVCHLIPINHAVIYICFLLFILMSARKETNLYLNLFLNISFVLIYLFCYYHATVIENIVYTRSIMYLAFAIFSIEMYNYHFDQILLYFWGDVFNLLTCLVFLIAVLCSTFQMKKNYVCLVLLDCKI